METITMAEAKTRFAELVDRVAAEHDRFTVTKNGRPHVMLISTAEWDMLRETVARLSTSRL
jgi:antitoxin YefM